MEFFDGRSWNSIGAAKQRALLAVLLINANRVVGADQLTAELWGERPPASAAGLLAGYVWRLRRALGDQPGRVLATRAPGYQLVVPPGSLDLHEYDDLVTAGRRRLAAGDPAAAVDGLTTALGLWRGAPLADVPLVPSVLTESARLEEGRLAVVETRIDAEITLGRHEAVLPELKLMVSQFPLRERLHAHLMLALYQAGQQAEALGAYRDLRQLLIDELGIEPSKPLRELQARILREDPLLLESAADRAPGTAVLRLAVPRTLPPDVPVFVDRAGELARITARLAAGEQRCAIHGLAGVGKTTLAVHAAHRVAARFPDGQIYLDLGAGAAQDPPRPVDAIGRLLAALGVPAADVPADEERAAALLRTALAGRRVVIVLDDVLDTGQIRALLPATPGSAVILAGRAAPAAVDGSGLLRLHRLPAAAATELLRRYAGADRVTADPGAAARIARLCEYLPLALRVAATRLAQRPEWTVADFAARLADRHRRLDLLSCNGLSVRDSLRASTRLLHRSGDDEAVRTLRLLGALDLPVVRTADLAALLDHPEPVVEQAAERLVDAGLLEPLRIDRFRVLELVRLFARTEYGTETPPVERGHIGGTTTATRVVVHAAPTVRRTQMSDTKLDLDATIAQYATFSFDDSTPLLDVGLESLALLRLAVEVATDDDAEIDASRLVDLHTVADLKGWLAGMIPGGTR
ncbi:MAG TPA: BTAD domain-containing putative transcriptional regulator [Actinophytocola sp.]|uniref:BTAD domain-containing putative transcriptional regulator n=1 Tax=Actinophytocola sp. TaxID=1872138 RepID=UPI002DBC88C5|nr:BTAD domain-containing putative transcriptional regulator [Actinophytocola sp.]HEU5471318.1 BTAD domain-containing putative transcriptional regulator [Actinophytocola sp.]